ncbi:MAG: cyclase family protein [Acidobacteria bacterium]|nr:cyclase family protein [Acidobacteriota bacterium]
MIRLISVLALAASLDAQTLRGWTKGKGFGWVYGKQDEVGALNAIRDPERVLAALMAVKKGKVYDLGVLVDRTSYKWPGHSPTEVMSYRSPDGVRNQGDIAPFRSHPDRMAFHSAALFISDNVGTQVDGLGHITKGLDNHWYNGVKESEGAGDFGLRKMDADTIPPMIGKAVLIDVAGWKGVDALPSNYAIGPKDLQAALSKQGVDVQPGDIVMIRTGTLRYWGETGADHAKIAAHDSAGINLAAAKWLVEEKGAVMIGSDTSGLEAGEDPDVKIPNAVHGYLLVDQGVHIGEFHFLEDLARNRVYRFTYMAVTNRVKGAAAGFAMRPIAIE